MILFLLTVAVGVIALVGVGIDALRTNTLLFGYFRGLTRRTRFVIVAGVLLYVLLFWYSAVRAGIVSESYVPSPFAVLGALFSLIQSGTLISDVAISLARVLSAFTAASIIGVVLGSLSGAFPRIAAHVIPLNSALRYIPPTAFISLSILWFGIGEIEKIVLIALGVVFYVLQMTMDAVKSVPRVLIEAAETLGATRWEVFRMVVARFAIPDILAVLRVNLGAAWTFLVVAELISAKRGLGHILASSQRFVQTPTLFAVIFMLGVMGYLSDTCAAAVISYAGRWRRTL